MRFRRHRIWLELAAAILLLGSLIFSWSRSLEVEHFAQVAVTTMSGMTIASTNGSVEAEVTHELPIPDPMSTNIWSRRLDESRTPLGRFDVDSRHGNGFWFKIVFPHWIPVGSILILFVWYFSRQYFGFKK